MSIDMNGEPRVWKGTAAGRVQRLRRHTVSDGEGRRAGAVSLSGAGGNGAAFGRGPKDAAGGVEPHGQGGKLRRNQRRRLQPEPAKRTLIVAMADGGGWRALAVRFDAKRRGVAEGRLELGRDPGCLGFR